MNAVHVYSDKSHCNIDHQRYKYLNHTPVRSFRRNKKLQNELKAIDFFCGAGGMTHGMSLAGINVLAGIDIDPICKETYELNNRTSQFIEADIKKISYSKLIRLTGIEKEDDYLIFAGCSPCQYWTKINTNKTKAKETMNLLKEFQRFVNYFKPGFVIIENVPGLYKNKEVNALSDFLGWLENHNYCYDDGLINANHYDVPQHRIRYLLIATRLSDSINLPEGEENEDLILRNYIGESNGFPCVNDGYKDTTNFMHTVASLSDKNRMRISITPKNGGTRLSWKDDPELQIPAYKNKDNMFKDVYGRMCWDKPAPTITTRFNSFSNGRFGHPEENRAISLREGATIQTFPKTYVFRGGSEVAIARQIGNAVPVQLSYKIGKYINDISSRVREENYGSIGEF
jgi:DNA (cytosine-5)-methyltransferase 1